MKTVAIILALAVITGKCLSIYSPQTVRTASDAATKVSFLSLTGCSGRAVRQQVATPTQWEAAVNRFWQYISDLNVQADGVLQNLKASQLSRELE